MVKEYLDYCDSSWGRFRICSIYNNILSSFPPTMNFKTFLDIGCGPAHIVQYLAPLFDSGEAIDLSEEMIRAIPNRTSNIYYRVSSFENYPENEKFDLVLCHNVLEYQEKKTLFLSKIANLLRDNESLLSLVVINRSKEVLLCLKNGLFAEAKRLHEKGFYSSKTFNKTFYLPTSQELEDLLVYCGFKVIAKRGIGVLYPNDYDGVDVDGLIQWEIGLRDDPEMLPSSTLIHYVCRRLSPEIT